MIRLLCFDAAFANWGMAKLAVDPGTGAIAVLDLRLIETAKDKGKQVRVNSSDLRRAGEIYRAALDFGQDCHLFAAEVPSGAQSARAATAFGIAVGLLAALNETRPLIQVQPTEVKQMVTGRRTASKDEMVQWATGRFPEAPWLRARSKGVLRLVDKNEHLADACAIGVTAAATTQFQAAVRMLGAITPRVPSQI